MLLLPSAGAAGADSIRWGVREEVGPGGGENMEGGEDGVKDLRGNPVKKIALTCTRSTSKLRTVLLMASGDNGVRYFPYLKQVKQLHHPRAVDDDGGDGLFSILETSKQMFLASDRTGG